MAFDKQFFLEVDGVVRDDITILWAHRTGANLDHKMLIGFIERHYPDADEVFIVRKLGLSYFVVGSYEVGVIDEVDDV